MGFESTFDVDSVQYADTYRFEGQSKAKCHDRDNYPVGWSHTGNESTPKPKSSNVKPKDQKKQENAAWGPVYKNRSNFTNMHCF